MKKILACLTMFLWLLTYGISEGSDWIEYARIKDRNVIYYLNYDGVTRKSKNVVKVWSKVIYDKPILDKFKKSLVLFEFNCVAKKSKFLFRIEYDTYGDVADHFSDRSAKWKIIPPETIIEKLYQFVCP